MEEGDHVGRGSGREGESFAAPKARIAALIQTISQYQDVYPVLQRGIQFLSHELCDGDATENNEEEIACSVESFVESGALANTVTAMTNNLDSPAFLSSCFELVGALIKVAEDLVISALWKTDILIVFDKIVHSVVFQNEPACVQLGISMLSKLVGQLNSIENGLWAKLVSTTAQAMLTNSLDSGLLLECLLNLKLLFLLNADAAVPATSANSIMKTLDQCIRQPAGVNCLIASASVVVSFRISSEMKYFGFSAPILAAGLYHCQMQMDLDESWKLYVEKLIQQPLQTAVHDSLTRLTDGTLPAKSNSDIWITTFQTAATKLLLGVVWKDEARACLDSGCVTVLTKVFTSGLVLNNAAIETILAQTLYIVSMHWPDETWGQIQVNSTGINKWVELISERCEEENDGLLHFLLAMMKSLLHCEGFHEAFIGSTVVNIFQFVLHKHHLLPRCTRLVVTILTSVPDICPTACTYLPALCCSVTEIMLALETNRSSQLECVKALSLLISQQSDEQVLLPRQHVRDIVRVMRSKLMDGPFIAEMLGLVVNTLLNASIRASFIDLGILQVASKAICIYQGSPLESIELNARWIVCDVAHKLDVTRNLSTLDPNAHISNGRAFNPQAISTEALDTCCCMIGALAFVKSLLPSLIEEGAIQCIVGMLRYAKQDLIVRGETSFARLVMTCFYALHTIVNAPIVTEVTETVTIEATCEGVDGQSVYSCLLDSGADAIVGCLEEALRLKKPAPLLVYNGCRLLQAILKFPLCISGELKSRWIAVATSILQRDSTQQNTRELLFGTTLMVLSRGKHSSEATGGQYIKMMKVILELLDNSIQRESSCTLLQAECIGAIRVLEEIAIVSDPLSDSLVSKCLAVLGKLIGIFILSPSVTAQDNLVYFDNSIVLFATPSYVNRLICRLDEVMVHNGVIESAGILDIAEDLKALEALLYSTQTKTMIDAYHRLFGYLAAVVEDITASAQYLGDRAPFFLELGCLTSQLLPTAQREEVINTALCHFAEDTTWHSMRWIAALADRGSSECTLIVEFVLLRIVSGHTILEPALLMELLDTLNYLLCCNKSKEIVMVSTHARGLQSVLWELIYVDVAHMDAKSGGYDVAVSLLGIISSLISSSSDDLFSAQSKKNGGETLVRFCLGALSNFLDTSASLTKLVLKEETFQTTSVILQHCIELDAEYVQTIIQHGATHHIFNISAGTITIDERVYKNWCVVVLGAVIQGHGLLYGEKLLRLSSDPSVLLVDLISVDPSKLSWSCFVDCITILSASVETIGWQSDCSALFVMLEQQSKHLVHQQAGVMYSCNVKKHISDTIARLSFKYGQLNLDTGSKMDDCLQDIAQSGLVFYGLFVATPSFTAVEYSTIVSLHLKIARRLIGLKPNSDRNTIEESAISLRRLLTPICILDEALADYLDFAATIYLSSSIRAAAWLFIDGCTNVLSTSIQRLTTGLVRPRSLENSILHCFSSLRDIYAARWESGEVSSVLELLKICFPDRWSQELLMESVLRLPQGLLHLFELARTAPTAAVQVVIMAFLFQHVNDDHRETQHISELELSAILSMIKQNVSGRVGDTSQRKLREVTGSEMLRSALETLKVLVRRKKCALVCSDLRGIDALYNVLCAPSQYEGNIHLTLEICCYLASYGADLAHESSTFALHLLFVFVETNVNCPRPRLAFLVLEYFLALGVSALSFPLLQHCRTQIVPVAARSYEEAEVFIQQLYITRQKLASLTTKPTTQVLIPNAITDKSLERVFLNECEIRKIILSSCRSIVQCTNGDDEIAYVDVNSSEKTVAEPLQYARLRQAIDQLSFVLDDPDMVMNQRYVSALVPALGEILVLHTVTTTTICTVMQIFDQIAFVSPSIVISNEQLDIPAMTASCSLHQRSSLPFAQHLCRFCNSIAAEFRAMGDDDFGRFVSLVPLLFELLHHWKSNDEIVYLSLATAHDLIGLMRIEQINHLYSGDLPALFNAAVIPFTSDSPTSWNWLKCILSIFNKVNKVTTQSAQAVITTVIGIIHMFMSHSFMVEKALVVLVCVYRENRQLPLRHLMESDGVAVILTCLKLHANDEAIVRRSLRLLVSLVSHSYTSNKTVDQLLTAAPAVSIILVSKKYPDNPFICGMCIELLYRLVGSFENHSERKNQIPGISGGLLRKKSELLTQLLDADIIPLLFDLTDNYSSRGDNFLLRSLLELLNCLTKDEYLRESAEVFHGLHELQQTIDRVLENNFDCAVVELAIDCLVNCACSEREIGHEWRELSMWLLKLVETIYNLETESTGMCVEKLIGILGRLTVDSAICKAISPKGSFTILELLAHAGDDSSLERALYGLLCTLCEDIAGAQIVIVYDAIRITAERMICHVDDEDTLLSSLCFLDLLVLNSGESYGALQDEAVFEALELVTLTYPEISGGQVYHIASTILEKLSALDYQSTRTKTVTTKPVKVLKPQLQIADSEKPFHDLLCEGGKFRVLWEAKPDATETIQVKLAPRGDYLLFKRKAASQLPRVERIFVSQLEVYPQRSLVDPSKTPISPSKKALAQSLLRENFEGDCMLRLKIRDEDVLIKTNSTRERVHWDQALQWLVSHRETRTSPMHSPPTSTNIFRPENA